MEEQNIKVMRMTDEELMDIVENGDRNTFLHFQAEREYNARHKGGRRKGEFTFNEFVSGMPDNSYYF